jgi:DNA-binding response OmpR family regulator
MVVENEPLVMEVLYGVLSEGNSVRCATTVEEACAFLRTSVVDLVLLDSVLPDGRGDDVMGLAEKFGVSVITMSGYPRDQSSGSKHGHLSKPFSVDTMLSEVQAVLRHRASLANG